MGFFDFFKSSKKEEPKKSVKQEPLRQQTESPSEAIIRIGHELFKNGTIGNVVSLPKDPAANKSCFITLCVSMYKTVNRASSDLEALRKAEETYKNCLDPFYNSKGIIEEVFVDDIHGMVILDAVLDKYSDTDSKIIWAYNVYAYNLSTPRFSEFGVECIGQKPNGERKHLKLPGNV